MLIPAKHYLRRRRRSKRLSSIWVGMLILVVCAVLGIAIVFEPTLAIAMVLGIILLPLMMIKPFEAFLVWLFLAPLLQGNDIDLGRFIPNLTFDRLMLTIVFIIAVTQKLMSRKSFGKPRLLDIMLVSFLAICAANIVLTRVSMSSERLFPAGALQKDIINTLQVYGDHYIYAFIVFYIIRMLVDTRRKAEILLTVLAATTLYLVPIGAYEHFTGITWFTANKELLWSDVGRAAGPFRNPSVYGAVLAICFVIAIHRVFQSKTKVKKVGYGLGIMLIAAGIVFTYTRAAWLAPVIAAIFMGLTYEGKRKAFGTWLLATTLILLLVFPVIKHSAKYQSRIMDKGPVNARIVVYRNSISMLKSKPIFGYGVNNFDYYRWFHPVYVPGVGGAVGPTSHNTYMTILVETGLVGFLPYMCVLFMVVGRWATTYARAKSFPGITDRRFLSVVGAGILGYMVVANLMDMRFFRYVEYLNWILLGLVCVEWSRQHAASDACALEKLEQMPSNKRAIGMDAVGRSR
ncbi:MAG: O-antigen ligase family protein [Armatimonadota bacterium]